MIHTTKYNIIGKVLTVLLLFTLSCDDDLELQPFQSISPVIALETEENIKNLLLGAYDESGQVASYGGRSQIIADLLGATNQVSWNGTFVDPREFFTKSILITNAFVQGVWDNNYETINTVNLVIDNLDKITSSTEEADRVEGEAKFLRALCYFDLVRNFALPFEAGQANTQLGVPIRTEGVLDFGQNLDIARSSVAEVYAQIINDLNEAYNKLPDINEEFADKYAARALMARVYFQQQDYASARDAANDVITNSGHTLAGSYAEAFNNDADTSEDIFAFQVTNQSGTNGFITFYASQTNGGRGGDIAIETGYLDLFDSPNDVRQFFFYTSPDNGLLLTSKYTNQFANVVILRVGEMHLIRAESNFREGTSIGMAPLEEINIIRTRSLATSLDQVSDTIFFDERQRELGFEGYLIHDYKRTYRAIDATPYNAGTLILPIPQSEMDTNSIIQQNAAYQ